MKQRNYKVYQEIRRQLQKTLKTLIIISDFWIMNYMMFTFIWIYFEEIVKPEVPEGEIFWRKTNYELELSSHF